MLPRRIGENKMMKEYDLESCWHYGLGSKPRLVAWMLEDSRTCT